MVGRAPRILWQLARKSSELLAQRLINHEVMAASAAHAHHRPGVYDRSICSWYQQMPQLRCPSGASRGCLHP